MRVIEGRSVTRWTGGDMTALSTSSGTLQGSRHHLLIAWLIKHTDDQDGIRWDKN